MDQFDEFNEFFTTPIFNGEAEEDVEENAHTNIVFDDQFEYYAEEDELDDEVGNIQAWAPAGDDITFSQWIEDQQTPFYYEVVDEFDQNNSSDELCSDGKLLIHDSLPSMIYSCGECNRSFDKKWRLRSHFATVHEKRLPHRCTMCVKEFRSDYDLQRHMTTHTGQRFVCDVCGTSFGSKQRVAQHIKTSVGCWDRCP